MEDDIDGCEANGSYITLTERNSTFNQSYVLSKDANIIKKILLRIL
jgi:hypothetical protein